MVAQRNYSRISSKEDRVGHTLNLKSKIDLDLITSQQCSNQPVSCVWASVTNGPFLCQVKTRQNWVLALFRRQGGWYNQNIVYAVDNDLKTSLGKLFSILIAIFECIKSLLWMERSYPTPGQHVPHPIIYVLCRIIPNMWFFGSSKKLF